MHSEKFEEFRGFQFSETFQKALRKIRSRKDPEILDLESPALNAEPSKLKGFRFLLFRGSRFDGELRTPRTFALLRTWAVAGLPTP